MNPFLFVIGLALLFGAAKKKTNQNVGVDFSVLQDGGRYALTFTDSLNNVTTFDSANGFVQTQSMPSGTYTIQLTKIDDANCPAYVAIAPNVFLSDLGGHTGTANLLGYYELITQCR